MIGTIIGLFSYIPTIKIELPKKIASVNIEYCENLYFTNFELFQKYNCDLNLVEKRIRQAKGIE